eukprot:6192747-Prymnesium_polylepis.1
MGERYSAYADGRPVRVSSGNFLIARDHSRSEMSPDLSESACVRDAAAAAWEHTRPRRSMRRLRGSTRLRGSIQPHGNTRRRGRTWPRGSTCMCIRTRSRATNT